MAVPWGPMLMLLCVANLHFATSVVNQQEGAALRSLIDQWQKLPPNWIKSTDPCDSRWDGVNCTNSRVATLNLNSMGLIGKLSGDIGNLEELESLDLSFNPDLTGPIPSAIGNLKKLNTLLLAGCGFSGNIPNELGNLPELYFLALNSNKLSGEIPASLGKLSKLYWLDLADNQLTGSLPVSTNATHGLDQLLSANHFHLSKNNLSGQIPSNLFNADMKLIHILLDGNQLNGNIPTELGLVKGLEVLRLDRNKLDGPVPLSFSNLTRITELHLANNQLSGPTPDLSAMRSLSYVDLSNNSFDASKAPAWFSTMESLTTLIVEKGSLDGPVPQNLFSLPSLQFTQLRNNSFDGILVMGDNIGQQLKFVDLENNNISNVEAVLGYLNTLELLGNPVCDKANNLKYCQLQQPLGSPYSTSLARCSSKTCSIDESLNPASCDCASPYQGTLFFRAPSFRDLTNSSRFLQLEAELWGELHLNSGSVSLQNMFFNADDRLQVHVSLFPSNETFFTRMEVQFMGSALTSQIFKPPDEFGPYFFSADPYVFIGKTGRNSISTGVIAAISVSCAVLVLLLAGVGFYAFRQKKRAERAIELSKPFASWAPSGKDSGGAPQLKGARWFSFDELKKCTSNFSERNEIGSGGYGKVYRGMLPGGQVVAIKRAQQGSMQGGLEFKTEIELLSRVHHKNLVGLVGFCFEQGEQMLVYEYVPNGTLRESLSGRSGTYLDWKRRLRIALGSARGLSYLHELANPPIIHRDVKSSNILLDESLTAKVADFGLSKLVSDREKGHVSTQVKGTLGYLDPEYYMTQQLTDKSDVYSFGVVMLELVTARQPIEKGKYVVREVRMAMDRNAECYGLKDMMDPNIRSTNNLIGFGRFVELAMQCVEETAAERPTMSEVVKEIETILQNNGMNSASTSASSSATDFGTSKGAASRHPYNDLPKKDFGGNSFDYSGQYSHSVKIEPK